MKSYALRPENKGINEIFKLFLYQWWFKGHIKAARAQQIGLKSTYLKI